MDRYVVPPSDQRAFAEKWLDLRSAVKEQKGNIMYTLSKVLGTHHTCECVAQSSVVPEL